MFESKRRVKYQKEKRTFGWGEEKKKERKKKGKKKDHRGWRSLVNPRLILHNPGFGDR